MYYGWADQVHRAAVSIPANVCEAQGRNSLAQRLQYTAVARGSVYEVFGLLLCPPPDTDVSKLLEDTREVIRLLDALVLEYARQRAEGG
jgi:four helix bundle protein